MGLPLLLTDGYKLSMAEVGCKSFSVSCDKRCQ